MKSNYIHSTPGWDYHSVLIKCSCGCSFIEVWINGYGDDEKVEAGVTYYGPQHKTAFPDFYFLSDDDFELFCNSIMALSKDGTPFEEPVTLGTQLNLKNGKVKFNGCLEINTDDCGFGFMDIIRRPKARSKKYWWDITIRDREFEEVSEALQELLEKYKKLKEVYRK